MTKAIPGTPQRLGLRAGDWVLVRSREEILATLDANARFDALPFQPEMLAFSGQRLRVAKVAHKTCDNIQKTMGRRMQDAVHLEGARCDGGGHGGCQADCVFFWKEAWLQRADAPGDLTRDIPRTTVAPPPSGACTEETVRLIAQAPGQEAVGDPVWVCQTTALYEATTLLPWWDFRQYIRDVTTGNHTAGHMVKILVAAGYRHLVSIGPGYQLKVALYNWVQQLRGGRPFPVVPAQIESGQPTPTEILNLQPGEWVEVRSGEEIGATITRSGMNRGMRYDMEMKSPCIQLADVYCRAECTPGRLGCPRASNSYWREIWLRRTAPP